MNEPRATANCARCGVGSRREVGDNWKRVGEFRTFNEWKNHANSWIGGRTVMCFDAIGRECRRGADFMRARDENRFPVSYYEYVEA